MCNSLTRSKMTCFASLILSGMCLLSTSTTAASNALFQLFMIPYSGVVLLRVAPRGVTYVIRISRMDCLVRYSALLCRSLRLNPPCPLSSRHLAPGCSRYDTPPIWFLFAVCDCIVLLMPLRPACLLCSRNASPCRSRHVARATASRPRAVAETLQGGNSFI